MDTESMRALAAQLRAAISADSISDLIDSAWTAVERLEIIANSIDRMNESR